MSALKIHVTEENHSNVPDWLEHDKRYIAITPIARLVYGKLRKKYMTSVYNVKTGKDTRYIDSNGEIYCVYTVKEFMRTLGISDKTVTRAKRELIKIGLIREVRQGRNLANLYYLLEDSFYESSTEKLKPIRKPKTGKPLKTAESYIVRPNYINNLNTLNNNNIVNKENSFQSNKIIDFKSYSKEKEPLNMDLEQKIIEIANKYYTEFTIGRWSKTQWNNLIAKFAKQNKNKKNIKNIHGFVYGSLKKMASYRDEKLNKQIETEEELSYPVSNSLDMNTPVIDIEATINQLSKLNINRANSFKISTFDWTDY